MKPIILTIPQGEDAWFQEKLGKLSASNASKLVTSTGKKSTSREGYLHTIVAERLTGERYDTFKSDAMETGNTREQESRDLFELMTGDTIEQVGLIYPDEDRKILCSPDGICQAKGYGLELKNVIPKTMIKYLLKNVVPSEYVIQIQFSLMVTGFEYWVFFAYSPNLKPLLLKVERDEGLIAILRKESEIFCEEVEALVEKIK